MRQSWARLVPFFFVLTVLFAGCSSVPDLPLKMNVTQIDVFAVSLGAEGKKPVMTISDAGRIQRILSKINGLPPTGFSDPEPESEMFEVHFHAGRKDTVFLLARESDGGKLYKRDSRHENQVWFVQKYLIEELTGESLMP